MKKKIPAIGSIIACIIILLAGLSPVIGFQRMSKTIAVGSPLFEVRTRRVINQESDGLSCSYIRQDETFLVPKRNNNNVLAQRIIKGIQGMDEERFEHFIASLTNYAQKDERNNGENLNIIKETLIQIRDNDKPTPLLDTGTKDKYYTPQYSTFTCPQTAVNCFTIRTEFGIIGFLVCFLLVPIYLIFDIIEIIIEFIRSLFHINTGLPGCIPPTSVVC